jgi:MFS transporter, SHS family, lactate transporter
MDSIATSLAVENHMGFAMPMLYSTIICLVITTVAVLLGPETKGKMLTSEVKFTV